MIRRSEKLNKNHCRAYFSPFHLNHNVRSTFSSSSFLPFVAPASATHAHKHEGLSLLGNGHATDGRTSTKYNVELYYRFPPSAHTASLLHIHPDCFLYYVTAYVCYVEYETHCSSSRQNLPSPQYFLFNSRSRVRGKETIPSHLSALARVRVCVCLRSTDKRMLYPTLFTSTIHPFSAARRRRRFIPYNTTSSFLRHSSFSFRQRVCLGSHTMRPLSAHYCLTHKFSLRPQTPASNG